MANRIGDGGTVSGRGPRKLLTMEARALADLSGNWFGGKCRFRARSISTVTKVETQPKAVTANAHRRGFAFVAFRPFPTMTAPLSTPSSISVSAADL